jgi:hypothetical protein
MSVLAGRLRHFILRRNKIIRKKEEVLGSTFVRLWETE